MSDFFRNFPLKDIDESNAGSNLVRQAISYLAEDEKHRHDLARTLLNPVAYYGGGEEEAIPDNVAAMVVRRWIHFNWLNDTFENFFIELLCRHQDLGSVTLSSLGTGLKKVLRDYTDDILEEDGAEGNRVFAERLWAWTIVPELPVLAYWQAPPYENFRLVDFDLGEAQAGLIFGRQSGIDISMISFEEAVELGKFVQVQVEENLAPVQWLLFYQLPALAKFIASRNGSYQGFSYYANTVYDALNYYFEEKDRYVEANNPFKVLAVAMANYKSRTTLAEEIVNKSCPSVSASEYLLKITPTCPEPLINHDDDHIPVSYILHRAGGPDPALLYFYPDRPGNVILPNIDDVFVAQNNAIAEKYSVVERLLLSQAWGLF
ncbi:hypothetical protein ABK905_19895 [Acerihabitans sp. KWT182]|uniref:Uncharacterized protein n=1 Tax=Acerihabitans sp. KWT182 TaxID=3157919 RepID=A0AAU7Q793_9GAMM